MGYELFIGEWFSGFSFKGISKLGSARADRVLPSIVMPRVHDIISQGVPWV
jgi:hypothetical protein